MSLVERIQNLCSSKDTTLIGLEREINLGRGTIRNWDKSSPSADKVQRVADYFGVSTDYLLYGFERLLLNQLIHYVKNDRTYEQFAEDTTVDLNELMKIGMGLILEPPSLSTIEKVAANNPVDYLVSRTDLLQAAGYLDEATAQKINNEETKKYQADLEERKYIPTTIAAHHDGEVWTEEELADIERFKEFVRSKRNAKN